MQNIPVDQAVKVAALRGNSYFSDLDERVLDVGVRLFEQTLVGFLDNSGAKEV